MGSGAQIILDQPVGQGRFAMVNVRNYREVSDFAEIGHVGGAVAKASGNANAPGYSTADLGGASGPSARALTRRVSGGRKVRDGNLMHENRRASGPPCA